MDFEDVSAYTVCTVLERKKELKNCQVPTSLAQHENAVRGDRGLRKEQSKLIMKETGQIIPVGVWLDYMYLYMYLYFLRLYFMFMCIFFRSFFPRSIDEGDCFLTVSAVCRE